MKLTTSTNILFERTAGDCVPMRESIRACAQAGFQNLDFGLTELSLISSQFHCEAWRNEIVSYKRQADELGLRFVQGHATIFDFCNPVVDQKCQHDLLLRSVQAAQILEIPWLAVHPSTSIKNGDVSSDSLEKNVRFFQSLGAYADDLGVGIAIENMWRGQHPTHPQYCVTAQEILDLVVAIDRSNVGICWDVEHASVEGLPQGDSIRFLAGHIVSTHISDETGRNNIHILPYTGNVKWDEIGKAFAETDYVGAFSLEIQHYLPSMPCMLISDAMHFAHSIGTYWVESIAAWKETLSDR